MAIVVVAAALSLSATWVLLAQQPQAPKIDGPTLSVTAQPTAPQSPPAAEATPATPPVPPSPKPVALEEEKAHITFKFQPPQSAADVLKMYSDLTGRSVIQNPAIAGVGNISVEVNTPLTKSEAILALESVLYAYGVSLTPMGEKFVKAVPNAQAGREGVALSELAASEMPEGDRMTAKVISLAYLDVADAALVQSLTQFIHQPGGLIVPLTRSNSILVIDTALTIKRLQEILEKLDQPVENRVQQKIYHLQNAEAAKVAATLQALITGLEAPAAGRPATTPRPPRPGAAQAQPGEESIVVGKVTIQSDDRTNSLIILSRPSNFAFFDEIIDALDRTMEPEIQFKSVKLQHAKAEEVAEIVLALTGTGSQPTIQRSESSRSTTRRLGSSGSSTSSRYGSDRRQTVEPQPQVPPIARVTPASTPPGQAAAAGVATPQFVLSERARIIPDPRQGSVLVLGTANDIELVDRIIREIDLSTAQVLMESVIVEMNLGNTTEFGVSLIQRYFTQDSVSGGGASLFGLSTNALIKPGVLTDPTKFAGFPPGLTYFTAFEGLDLDMIVRALATSSNFKILQTPMVQTTQNEPAHIFIGETRPIVTATQTGFSSGDSTIPVRSSIEQFDIGVTLDITPNITPGGLVELEILQAVEDVTGNVVIDGNEQPIVARREFNSLVSVRDRGVVVLGGLIRNGRTKSENKVPVLGDVPVLGYLFKSTRWVSDRNELIVLVRPTVFRTADLAQEGAQKMRERFKGLDNIPKDKLPPLPQQPAPVKKKPWYAPVQPPKG